MKFREFLEGKQWATYDPHTDEYLDDKTIPKPIDKSYIDNILNNMAKAIKPFLKNISYFKFPNQQNWYMPVDFSLINLGEIVYNKKDGTEDKAKVLLTNDLNTQNNSISSMKNYYSINGNVNNKIIKLGLGISKQLLVDLEKDKSLLDKVINSIVDDFNQKVLIHEISHLQRSQTDNSYKLDREKRYNKINKQTSDYQRDKIYSTEIGDEWEAEMLHLFRIYQDMTPEEKQNSTYRELIEKSVKARYFLSSKEQYEKTIKILFRKGVRLKSG